MSNGLSFASATSTPPPPEEDGSALDASPDGAGVGAGGVDVEPDEGAPASLPAFTLSRKVAMSVGIPCGTAGYFDAYSCIWSAVTPLPLIVSVIFLTSARSE